MSAKRLITKQSKVKRIKDTSIFYLKCNIKTSNLRHALRDFLKIHSKLTSSIDLKAGARLGLRFLSGKPSATTRKKNMFSNSLKTKIDDLVAVHFNDSPVEKVSPPSAEWVDSLKYTAERVESRAMHMVCAAIAISFGAALATTISDTKISTGIVFVVLLGLVALGLMVAANDRARHAKELTQQLALGGNCTSALALIEQYDACRDYQIEVLAQGREFVEADYLLLLKIAQAQPGYVAGYETTLVCKKLHGLTDACA